MPLRSLGIAVALILLLFGAVLVYRATSGLDPAQGMTVIGGAALLSLGVTILGLLLKSQLTWRREYKKHRDE